MLVDPPPPGFHFFFQQDCISCKQTKKYSRDSIGIACNYWLCSVYQVREKCFTCNVSVFISQPHFPSWTTNLQRAVSTARLTALLGCFFSLSTVRISYVFTVLKTQFLPLCSFSADDLAHSEWGNWSNRVGTNHVQTPNSKSPCICTSVLCPAIC